MCTLFEEILAGSVNEALLRRWVSMQETRVFLGVTLRFWKFPETLVTKSVSIQSE